MGPIVPAGWEAKILDDLDAGKVSWVKRSLDFAVIGKEIPSLGEIAVSL